MKVCSICGRGGPIRRGWCTAHYSRWRHHGDPLGGGRGRDGWPSFWFGVMMLGDPGDDCILWPFGNNGHYGVLRPKHGEPGVYVHSLACQRAHGPRPEGMTASHLCGHSLCINRRHLVWETMAENHARKVAHGTDNRGERHAHHRLSEADVVAIRSRYAAGGVLQRELAAEYGVAKQTVSGIIHGCRWAHVA